MYMWLHHIEASYKDAPIVIVSSGAAGWAVWLGTHSGEDKTTSETWPRLRRPSGDLWLQHTPHQTGCVANKCITCGCTWSNGRRLWVCNEHIERVDVLKLAAQLISRGVGAYTCILARTLARMQLCFIHCTIHIICGFLYKKWSKSPPSNTCMPPYRPTQRSGGRRSWGATVLYPVLQLHGSSRDRQVHQNTRGTYVYQPSRINLRVCVYLNVHHLSFFLPPSPSLSPSLPPAPLLDGSTSFPSPAWHDPSVRSSAP